jgi:RecA-family ATPase
MRDKIFSKDDVNKENLLQFETHTPEWICMTDVTCKEQKWFWPGMIPDETLTLFAGVGGIGKSLLLLYLISMTSVGKEFKAGGMTHKLRQGSIILLSAEDDIETQIKPKLIAHEANCSKIHFIKSKIGSISKQNKFLELDKDIFILEQKINELKDVSLIVIDPITYFIGNVKDVSTEVANFLLSLSQLSKKYNFAIILNKHLRKSASGAKGIISAIHEVAGSGAWVNTPRKCLLITNHHDEKEVKVISNMKDNLTVGSDDCLAYKIRETTIIENNKKIITTKLEWLSTLINMSATDAIDKEIYEKSKLQQAIDFIFNYLMENGQSVVVHIREKALKKGIKQETFRRAESAFEQAQGDNLIVSKGIRGSKIYNFSDSGAHT